MNTARRLFWFIFIAVLFVPGLAAHRSDRNPQTAPTVVASAGDVTEVNNNFNVPDNTTLIKGDASGGNITITLPDAATVPNVSYKVVKIDSSTNTVTVDAVGGDTIGDSDDFVLDFKNESIVATSDGANYVSAVPMNDWVDIRLFNPKGDGVTDDRAAIAAAAVAANGGELVMPPGTYRIASNLSLDENVVMEQGALWDVDAGVTVTFTGAFSAPETQVFTGSGDVDFSSAQVIREPFPIWWGIDADNAADDAAQIADMISDLGNVNYVVMSPGAYDINTNVSITLPMKMEPGAYFDIAAGATLTVNADIITDPGQFIFDTDSGGSVTYGANFNQPVDIVWYSSSDPLGVSDSSDAWIEASADISASAAAMKKIRFSEGFWLIDNNVDTDIAVQFLPGAFLDVEPGDTVTLREEVEIPPGWEIFDTEGNVVFYNAAVEEVDMAWFGGDPADNATIDQASIQSAIDAAVDAGANAPMAIRIPPGVWNLDDDLDIEGSTLNASAGAIFDIASGKFFFIGSGKLEAGLSQLFQGSGVVSFDEDSIEYVLPQWWGAAGDNSTDNHAAFESAIAAAATVGRMYIPPGIYLTTATIDNFPSALDSDFSTGYIIEGAGPADTIIRYTGVAGYAIAIWDATDNTNVVNVGANYVTLRDFRVQVPNTGAAGGGGIDMPGTHFATLQNIHFDDIDVSNGTAIRLRRRPYTATEASFTNDINRDFTTSGGGGLTESYAIAWTTPAGLGGKLKTVTVRLGKTGAPAGTSTATLYSDAAGPNAVLGGVSGAVTNTALSAAADGADQDFTFILANRADLSASTKYWIVIDTSGYTYTDGVTEVRLRVDAGAGAANTFATFDDGGGGWSTSNDGSNHVELVGRVQSLWNYINRIEANNASGEFFVGIDVQDDSQTAITNSSLAGKTALKADGSPQIFASRVNFDSNDAASKVIDFDTTSGQFTMHQSYVEGTTAAVPIDLGSTKSSLVGCILGAFINWDAGTQVDTLAGVGPYYVGTDSEAQPSFEHKYMIYTPNRGSGTRSINLGNTATTSADADALTGTAWSLPASSDLIDFEVGNAVPLDSYLLPNGTYLITIHAKATTPDGTDLQVWTRETNAGGATIANEVYGLTTGYEAYHLVIPWLFQEDKFTRILSNNVAGVFVSHIELRYMGPANPYQRDIVGFNTEASDADGDRTSRLVFQGIQSGTEQSLLASIIAKHDGAVDDEQGRLEFGVNDGNDGFALTTKLFIDADGDMGFGDLSVTIADASQYEFLIEATKNIRIDGRINPRNMTEGVIRFLHTPAIADTRTLHFDVDANSMPDTHAIFVSLIATGIAAGEDVMGFELTADKANSTGGSIEALRVNTAGAGSAVVDALHADPGVRPLHQEVGTFGNIEQAWDEDGGFTDVTADFNSSASDVTIFSANADMVHIGDAADFNALEVNLDTVASGAGVKPTYEFSIAGPGWTVFVPNDGTNGFRSSGTISWDEAALTGWVATTINGVNKQYIRITRTQVGLSTPPIEDTIQISVTVEYGWDENGDITANLLGVSDGSIITGEEKYFNFTLVDPPSLQASEDEWGIVLNVPDAITISRIEVSLKSAANEMTGDIVYVDALISLANPVIINDFDTTSGVRDDSSISVAAVPAGKVIIVDFDGAAPNAAITQAAFKITYTID